MRRYRHLWLLLWIAWLPSCGEGALPKAHSAEHEPALETIERLTGGATAQQALPLLLVLHGLGDTPDAFVGLYTALPIKARVIAARAPDPWGEGRSWYPIDDPARKLQAIAKRADSIASLLAHLTKVRPTLGKPIVSGFSQGGVLSFALASLHPASIAQALPIAGTLPSELWPKHKLTAAPWLVAFHGENDRRIPLKDAQLAANALAEQGARLTLKTYPGVGHSIPATMQRDLYDALISALRHESANSPEKAK